MSYLSTSGNVGYSSLSQISDSSCATQYKMGVEGTGSGASACGEDEDLSYYPHSNEQLFGSKFKVDGADLFTFHDSDVVAGEITVCDDSDIKLTSPHRASPPRCISNLANGLADDSSKHPANAVNGHLPHKTIKISNKPIKSSQSPCAQGDNLSKANSISEILASVGPDSPLGLAIGSPKALGLARNSISSHSKEKLSHYSSTSNNQSFLDVFKKEMGTLLPTPLKKEAGSAKPKKTENKSALVKKVPSAPTHRKSKSRSVSSGRGPAQHEALERIRTVPPPPPPPPAPPRLTPHRAWHAPGPHAHECTPLTDKKHPTPTCSSSDDDSEMPNFGTWVLTSADDAEAGGGEARGARLAARRATLRRQVAHAAESLRLTSAHAKHSRLAQAVRKHISEAGPNARLSPRVLNELLAARGLSSLFTGRDRRRLRNIGWSSSGSAPQEKGGCAVAACGGAALPCCAHCAEHVTQTGSQRLYADCAGLLADGARCRRPVLPLHHTPLCSRHVAKRDIYDRTGRDGKPRKVAPPRKRPSSSGASRRDKRRRPPPPPPPRLPRPPSTHNVLPHELSVCSNSSAYDSSEDAGVGALSETEFITAADPTLDAGVAQHVLEAAQAPDDILDSSVLHQIPDEAFTEFFNHSGGLCEEGGGELARALQAVLDERALDSLADCVFPQPAHNQVATPRSAGVGMSSGATS